jgi:hypothetical protein
MKYIQTSKNNCVETHAKKDGDVNNDRRKRNNKKVIPLLLDQKKRYSRKNY